MKYGGRTEKYTAIFQLRRMLEDACIPFEFDRLRTGYMVWLNEEIDAMQDAETDGNEQDLIEIMGAQTEEEYEDTGGILGNLTAEEVFKRFKYCYDNKTTVYIKEG